MPRAVTPTRDPGYVIRQNWAVHLTGAGVGCRHGPSSSGTHYPKALGDFQAWFQTDADCLDYLEWLRWPNGFVCPACGLPGGWRLGDGRYQCSGCGRRTSVIAGTIFDRTRTPLTVWFAACWHFATGKTDLSAELEADLGDRVLPDGMGHASSPPVCPGPPGSGAPQRASRGGRDLYRRAGAGTLRWSCPREESPSRYRYRDPGPQRVRSLPDDALGGRFGSIPSSLR